MMDHKKQLPAAAAEDSPAAEADEACTPSNDCSSRISTFLRVKPVARPTGRILLEPLDGSVEFRVPRDQAAGPVNNSRERYCFSFDGILTPEAKQDEVFERVARPVVASTLDGYNGTVFAYGQTGSGKTFTITGGAERYVDRGVIPRTISSIFKELASRTGHTYQVYISYLEIYNEVGYDLLDPTREVQAMEDLPQVSIMEDEEQNINFKNLSVHRAATEEEALNLLFLGDTNRTISETPMNQASSRSHCIFTISLEARRAGSDVVRHSKLHLVDLAGSERVAKTGVDGTTLKEAKYINLSLHYLEQVIIALQERSMGLSRVHVPYRNSLMTLVLRDSLGGNCKTVMVATISGEAGQIEESISTCRFAQRVALVTNEVSVNESVDPAVIISRLKQEVRDLKEEVALLRGNAPQRGPLTPDELMRLRQQLLAYVGEDNNTAAGGADVSGGGGGGGGNSGSSGSSGSSAGLNFGGDMMMIRASWMVFKQLVLEGRDPGRQQTSATAAAATQPTGAPGSSVDTPGSIQGGGQDAGQLQALQDQARKLRLQVQQRDNEIALMLNMLKGRNSSSTAASSSSSQPQGSKGGGFAAADAADTSAASDSGCRAGGSGSGEPVVLSALLDASLLSDRHRAFEVFKQSYRQGQVLEDNKLLLRAKYDEAKALGEAVNAAKGRINDLKGHIELWRAQRAAACVSEGRDPAVELTQEDPREQRAKQQIEQEKASYKSAFSQLRGLKGEIEHLQLLLEQSRKKLQQDFQQWLGMVARQQQQQQQQPTDQAATASTSGNGGGGGGVHTSSSSSSRPSTAQRRGSGSNGSSGGVCGATSDALPAAGKLSPPPSSRVLRKAVSAMPGSSSLLPAAGSVGNAAAAAEGSTTRELLTSHSLALTSSSSGGSSFSGSGSGSQQVAALDLSKVDPKLLQAAGPHLTGNAEADADIIRFYEAKEKLLQLKLFSAG